MAGGGDSAAKEALLLAEYGKKVYICVRGDALQPEPINMNRINERIKKVEVERKLMEFVDYQMICDIDCKTFDVIYNYFLENDVDLSEDLFAKTAIYNLVAYASGFFGGVRIK